MKVKFTTEIMTLWVGDVKNAVSYLESLPFSVIKNQKWLNEQINYLKRKEYSITC